MQKALCWMLFPNVTYTQNDNKDSDSFEMVLFDPIL